MRKSRVNVEKTHNANNISKRTTVSFQCERNLWNQFDALIVEKYGNYKKSMFIEDLIRKYMKQQQQKKESNSVNLGGLNITGIEDEDGNVVIF